MPFPASFGRAPQAHRPAKGGLPFSAAFVVLLSTAFRLFGLEWVRHNYDRSFPHGLGIFIRDAIMAGHFDQLPKVSLVASINFPNPAGTSYVYALLTAIEPSIYVATALNALLGALVTAIAYELTRRMFASTWAATAAGLLAALSPWAAWVGRGTWLQGPIEGMAALAFWLFLNAFTAKRPRPRYLAAALAWVGLCMQTYLVAFGLFAQALAVTSVGLSTSLRGRNAGVYRNALITGLLVCAVSLVAYGGAIRSVRASLTSVVENPNAINSKTRAGETNLDPISHVLRIASGRDYENTFVETDTPNYALRNDVSDAHATLIDLLFLAGLVITLLTAIVPSWPILRLPTHPRQAAPTFVAARMLLVWLALPVLGTFVIANWVMRDWEVHVFYMLLTSPAPYMLVACPLAWVEFLVQRQGRGLLRGSVRVALVVAALVVILIPVWNLQADVEGVQRFPYNYDGLPSLPIKWQMRLIDAVHTFDCATLDGPDAEWQTSVMGSASAVRAGNYRAKNDATIWQVPASGGGCTLQINPRPVPANAALTTVKIPGLDHTTNLPVAISLYRALPLNQSQARSQAPLTTNLGWSLVDLQTPSVAQAGQSITITHVWRIDDLPNEDYLHWYFAPFVKLRGPGGRTIADVNGAPALEGFRWLRGWDLISTIHINLPADLTAGDYTLELSLFDPNQKKNAVYFNPVAPSKPIVTIERHLTIK